MDLVKTEFEVLDERFASCNGDEWMQRLHTGCRWTEGPAYFPAGRYLVFSDIPNDRILRWDETTGAVGVFRQPVGLRQRPHRGPQGRLVSCEHGNRRVTRTEHDGTVTVLADRYGGKRLNSPNDVVEHSDGSIWFTDPSYGIDSDYEGYRADSEIGACHVYRVDPADGEVRIVADDFDRPNGLAFSVDESRLYIVDTRQDPATSACSTWPTTARSPAARCSPPATAGRSTGSGSTRPAGSGPPPTTACTASHPDGTRIGKLLVPEVCSNLTFGGPQRNELFITASSSRLHAAGQRQRRPLPHASYPDKRHGPCCRGAGRRPQSAGRARHGVPAVGVHDRSTRTERPRRRR